MIVSQLLHKQTKHQMNINDNNHADDGENNNKIII